MFRGMYSLIGVAYSIYKMPKIIDYGYAFNNKSNFDKFFYCPSMTVITFIGTTIAWPYFMYTNHLDNLYAIKNNNNE